VFGQFGKFVHATVRHREDPETGRNTSWALVTMGSVGAAELALEATPIQVGEHTITITRYDVAQAAQSKGGMVNTLAAYDESKRQLVATVDDFVFAREQETPTAALNIFVFFVQVRSMASR
jgi:hypothetical protein